MTTSYARAHRTTKETDIDVALNIFGSGTTSVETGIPFFDHMLDAFARHATFDLTIKACGDLDVDAHHTVEDVGLVLGRVLADALGDKAGITRFGDACVPMDEALVLAAIDVSGRGQCHYELDVPFEMIGSFETSLAHEFWIAFASSAGLTLHIYELQGRNSHHIIEASFKAVARALRIAVAQDQRILGVPSTKGSL